ncbi:MAG: hypothetical protein C0496_15690 [Erythrobacter sp.]|nr:hypothetical protein [Erythrobacter sp.]
MVGRFIPLFVGIGLIAGIGGLIHWLSGMDIIVCAVLVAGAMILISLLAEWEDRQPGGFLNSKGKNPE